jgi:dihydrodipicolinate synthase/N-acetylneuraminate lyase
MKTMSPVQLPRPVRGIIPPMVTPLASTGKLDHRGLEILIEHILAGGVHGLFILGTTGEGPSLSFQLRRELMKSVCHQVAGRIPVLVGITDTSCSESMRMAEWAQAAGAQGLVYAGPCYFPVSQDELLSHLERLTAELPLPVYLYNIPSHTKLSFDVETVRIAADMPQVFGIKDSSGDLDYFRRLCRALADRPDFALLIGPEELLADALMAGGHGGVCGGANLCPELYVGLYRAVLSQDTREITVRHKAILELCSRIYHTEAGGASYLKGLKCALSILELCSDEMAEPFVRFGPRGREIVQTQLLELGLLVKARQSNPTETGRE